ncbi:hypothetical protein [Streptomyces sp. NPDC004726]
MSRLLQQSIDTAAHWAKTMPREAARLAHRARLYTLASATLSLTTALLAWPLIAGIPPLYAQTLISTLSALAALTLAAPHVTGLHDRATEAIKLCSAYTAIHQDLLHTQSQLTTGTDTNTAHATDALHRYQLIQQRRHTLTNPGTTPHNTALPALPVLPQCREADPAESQMVLMGGNVITAAPGEEPLASREGAVWSRRASGSQQRIKRLTAGAGRASGILGRLRPADRGEWRTVEPTGSRPSV